MHKQEQKQFDKDAQKKALIGNGIILFVLVIGIILAVFCWFSLVGQRATGRGVSIISADNLDVRFNTYPGEIKNGKVVYDEDSNMNLNNDSFDEEHNQFLIVPGDRVYFKTVISNYETMQISGRLCLQNLLVNKALMTTENKTYVSFGSSMENSDEQQAFDLATGNNYYEEGTLSTVYNIIGLQTIYSGITLDAATIAQNGDRIPHPVIVYWYMVVNGDTVDNDNMGKPMSKFKAIKFVADG